MTGIAEPETLFVRVAGATTASHRTTKGDPRQDIGRGKSADVKEQKDNKPINIKL